MHPLVQKDQILNKKNLDLFDWWGDLFDALKGLFEDKTFGLVLIFKENCRNKKCGNTDEYCKTEAYNYITGLDSHENVISGIEDFVENIRRKEEKAQSNRTCYICNKGKQMVKSLK